VFICGFSTRRNSSRCEFQGLRGNWSHSLADWKSCSIDLLAMLLRINCECKTLLYSYSAVIAGVATRYARFAVWLTTERCFAGCRSAGAAAERRAQVQAADWTVQEDEPGTPRGRLSVSRLSHRHAEHRAVSVDERLRRVRKRLFPLQGKASYVHPPIRMLVHGQVTVIFVVSVCLSICLFVCAEFFSAVFDPISIKLGYMLYVWV